MEKKTCLKCQKEKGLLVKVWDEDCLDKRGGSGERWLCVGCLAENVFDFKNMEARIKELETLDETVYLAGYSQQVKLPKVRTMATDLIELRKKLEKLGIF